MEYSTKNKLVALALKEIRAKHWGDNKAMGEAMVQVGKDLNDNDIIQQGNNLIQHSLRKGLIR